MDKYELQKEIRRAQKDVVALNRILDNYTSLQDVPTLIMNTRLRAQDVLNKLLEKQEVELLKP